MERKCYFYNCGTTFDKNDTQLLYNCWNYNPNCCKSDLCNGLWCEDYGIYFNKKTALNHIKEHVKNGVPSSYGYLKEVSINLDEEVWQEIEEYLVKEYLYSSKDVKTLGFIPFDFDLIVEENSSYWEQPDISYFKNEESKILQDSIDVKEQKDLDSNTINWINTNIYHDNESKKIVEDYENQQNQNAGIAR